MSTKTISANNSLYNLILNSSTIFKRLTERKNQFYELIVLEVEQPRLHSDEILNIQLYTKYILIDFKEGWQWRKIIYNIPKISLKVLGEIVI